MHWYRTTGSSATILPMQSNSSRNWVPGKCHCASNSDCFPGGGKAHSKHWVPLLSVLHLCKDPERACKHLVYGLLTLVAETVSAVGVL